MKTLWTKFKHWLIRKLGGYIAPTRELKIEHTYVPVATITATLTFPDNFQDTEYIKEALAHKLGKELENYMTIHTEFNPETSPFEKTYRAIIKVAKIGD